MRIFLSHASDDKQAAESLAFSLRNRGHSVFLDRDDLPPGETYDKQIELAVRDSDLFIFLISPASVVKGRYTLTELSFARKRWPDPHGRLLPVMVAQTPMDDIPSYLKAVTILEPLGSVTAETAAAVDELGSFSRAKAVAWQFAAFGAAAGVVASFLPYKLPSIFGFRILGVAPDIGVCIGLGLAASAYWLLRMRNPVRLTKLVAVTLPLWFALAWTLEALPFVIVHDATSQLVEGAILDNENVDESTKETFRQSLQQAESYSKLMNWSWSALILVALGAVFAGALTTFVSRALGVNLSNTDHLISLSLGALSGLIWKIVTSTDITAIGRMTLIPSDGPDSFGIWSSLGLMIVMVQWMALVFAAVGYSLGKHIGR